MKLNLNHKIYVEEDADLEFDMENKEKLLANATNKHDRELMRKDLEKFEKKERITNISLGIAIILVFIGGFGIILISDYFVITFLPVLILVIFAQLNLAGLF